jgi:hypothetical protein
MFILRRPQTQESTINKESRDYLEMTYRSISCFADDGTLNVSDLEQLVSIAMRDGEVDENEKRVLVAIIKRLNPSELTPAMLTAYSGERDRSVRGTWPLRMRWRYAVKF